jgi:hypothetical protein
VAGDRSGHGSDPFGVSQLWRDSSCRRRVTGPPGRGAPGSRLRALTGRRSGSHLPGGQSEEPSAPAPPR